MLYPPLLRRLNPMKPNSVFSPILFLGLFLWVPLLLAADEGLAEGELLVDIRYPTQTVRMILVGMKDGELILRTAGVDRGERAYLNIRELERQGTTLDFVQSEDYLRALRQARRGDYATARTLFRRSLSPSLRYLQLGSITASLILQVDPWIETVIELENWSEAIDLIDRIDLRIAPRQTFNRVISLAQTLYEVDMWTDLRSLEQRILRIEQPNPMQRAVLLRLGHFWRENRLYPEAARIYARVTGFEGDDSREAYLWALFTSLFKKEIDHDLMDEDFETRPAHRHFPLELLIQSKLAILEEDFFSAMRHAAEAFAYSGPEETYHPEILNLLGELYLQSGEITIASQIFRQGQLLYPETIWEKRFSQSLQSVLPESSL